MNDRLVRFIVGAAFVVVLLILTLFLAEANK